MLNKIFYINISGSWPWPILTLLKRSGEWLRTFRSTSFCVVFAMPLCASVYNYVPCGHLLGKGWPLGSRLWFCHFPIGILGHVWYLVVSIPDLCTLTYFNYSEYSSCKVRWLSVFAVCSYDAATGDVVLNCVSTSFPRYIGSRIRLMGISVRHRSTL